jgi:hypothetical protein
MSFIEHAYRELKAIDPSLTADQFSTKWLNKCNSYYRSYKASGRDMTLHAMICLMNNLSHKAHALRMNNDSNLLHKRATQYQAIKVKTEKQISEIIAG